MLLSFWCVWQFEKIFGISFSIQCISNAPAFNNEFLHEYFSCRKTSTRKIEEKKISTSIGGEISHIGTSIQVHTLYFWCQNFHMSECICYSNRSNTNIVCWSLGSEQCFSIRSCTHRELSHSKPYNLRISRIDRHPLQFFFSIVDEASWP